MSRYTEPYERFRGMGNVAGPSAAERRQAQSATGTADLLRMLAGAAPAAGTAIGAAIGGLAGGIPTAGAGALPGASAGAAIGGALGQLGGSLAGAGADMAERPALERQQARDRQIEMMLQAFGNRR